MAEAASTLRPQDQIQRDLVYDVGAQFGDDSDFYLKLGYRVVAVEADATLAEKLRERFADEIAEDRYVLIDKAIAATSGKVVFFANTQTYGWGTIDPAWARRFARMGSAPEPVTIDAVTFDTILREHGVPHYLKVDIEGADALCIDALMQFEQRPQYLSMESCETSWRKLANEIRTLDRLGYRRYKLVRQGTPQPGEFSTYDGRLLSYEFSPDASGPFGCDLGGKWLSRRQALRRHFWIILSAKLFGGYTPVGRLLCKLPLLHRIPAGVGWYDTHAAR